MAKKPLRVLSVASEAVPLVKTGGLADVAGALPEALSPYSVEVTTMLPGYPQVLEAIGRTRRVHTWKSLLGTPARLLSAKLDGRQILVLDAPALFQRKGGIYGDETGRDWDDNWLRFAAFSRAAVDIACGVTTMTGFDLVHAHDWQAAMAPAYMRYAPPGDATPVPTVLTVHNIAFQGCFDPEIFPRLGLPGRAWAIDGAEYYGLVSYLKAGLASASAITTVSPQYAMEIRTSEFGMGLEGLISARAADLHGIVNGIDTMTWNPGKDPHIPKNYTSRSLARRQENKRVLESEYNLEPGDGPLFIAVSRLTWQKGMDVLAETIDHLVQQGGRLVLLGAGDQSIEARLQEAAKRHPGRVGVRIGYDEPHAHCMLSGGDAILVPSRFEPCGLTQLYGLAYGCVPVVARTGGLADTVIDANYAAMEEGVATGIVFANVTVPSLANAISHAIRLFGNKDQWQAIQRSGMAADFTWKRSGKAYAELFASLIEKTK